MHRPLTALTLTVFALSAAPTDAEACSPTLPSLNAVAPADGALDLPANPVLLLSLTGFGPLSHTVEFQVEGATTAIDLGQAPRGERAQNLGAIDLPAQPAGTRATVTLTPLQSGTNAGPTVVTFTYGAEMDSTPPSTPAPPELDVQRVIAGGNTCGPLNDSDRVSALVPTALGADVAAYAVFRETDAPSTAPDLAAWTLVTEDHDRLGLGLYEDNQEICAYARTMDHAGHWSAASPSSCVPVNSGCTSTRGSLPLLAALGLWIGAAALLRRRRD